MANDTTDWKLYKNTAQSHNDMWISVIRSTVPFIIKKIPH